MNESEFQSVCYQTWGTLFEFVESYEELYADYWQCFENVIVPFYLVNDSRSCPPEFDCFGCWPPTDEGQTTGIPCSPRMQLFDVTQNVHRECGYNNSWSQGPFIDYANCISEPVKNFGPIYLFIAGYALSIALLLLSVFILGYFRQLRCDRNWIHMNLFVSFIMTGFLWILYYGAVTLDGYTLEKNPVWCRVIHVLCQYFTICNFFWMFCEGFYLHTVLVLAFHTGRSLLVAVHIVGWVLPFLFLCTYAALRATGTSDVEEDGQCWVHWNKLQWINFGPIIASMLLNILFLANIVRVIVKKLRAFNLPTDDNSSHTRKAVRATVILVPLLGIQFLIMPVRPEPGTVFEEVYLYIAAILTSLQGACVALIYCIFNGEVLGVLRRRWKQLRPIKERRSNRGVSGNTMTTYTDNANQQTRDSTNWNEVKDTLDMKPLTKNHPDVPNDDTQLMTST